MQYPNWLQAKFYHARRAQRQKLQSPSLTRAAQPFNTYPDPALRISIIIPFIKRLNEFGQLINIFLEILWRGQVILTAML